MTFLGASSDAASGEVAAVVAGAAVVSPYVTRGAHSTESPSAIRGASARLAAFVGNHDFDTGRPFAPWLGRLSDIGDIATDERDPAGNRRRVRETVAGMLDAGRFPVLLGGDDSTTIPFLDAWAAHGPITILHLDAHLDYRDAVDGNRYGYSSPMRRASEMPWVERIIHVGQRGVGSARPDDVTDSLAAGNVIVTAAELERGWPACVLDHVAPGLRVAIVLDVDVIDPTELPAVRAPVASGPSIRDIVNVIDGIGRRASLQGLVVTEFEPSLDPHGMSARMITHLVARTLDVRFGAMAGEDA